MTLNSILKKANAVNDIVILYRPVWASKKAVPTQYDFSGKKLSAYALTALSLAWVEDIDVYDSTLYIGCRGLLPQKGKK